MISLFPSAVLDSSILTSVLIGLLVTWILQETLGWNFTGIVVPGYLASILVIQPLTGAVVAFEAILTCLVVRAISDGVPRRWLWTPLFGRDRFFLIMAVSVAVRLLFEGGGFGMVLPQLGDEATELHSIGLVLVPLAANALWRTRRVIESTRHP